MKISVIICTYNPTERIFRKVLESVSLANVDYRVYEILLVDNNSVPELNHLDYVSEFLKKNSNSRLIIEHKQGLTPARLRGINESTGEYLVFIDDDNQVASNYFSEIVNKATEFPFVGAFSGNVRLSFEVDPPEWIDKYKGLLVHREVSNDIWSNLPSSQETMPCGAGLCIRRDVANHYLGLHEKGLRTILLDRTKNSLMSAGDNDIALCACDIGLGMGLFASLHINHIIPSERINREYIKKLVYGIYYSGEILNYVRGKKIQDVTFRQKIKNVLLPLTMGYFDASVYRIGNKARIDARQWAIMNLKNDIQ